MHIAPTKTQMNAVLDSLRIELRSCTTDGMRERKIARARKQIELIRKAFQHQLDERALNRARDLPFGFATWKAMESELAQVSAESLAALEAMR
jgi:hypothetical protein